MIIPFILLILITIGDIITIGTLITGGHPVITIGIIAVLFIIAHLLDRKYSYQIIEKEVE